MYYEACELRSAVCDVIQNHHGRPRRTTTTTTDDGRRTTDDGLTVLELRHQAPYDWSAMLAFLSARAIPGVECVVDDRYARTIAAGGVHGAVIVRPVRADALGVEIFLSRRDVVPQVVERLQRLFDLAADPTVIGAHFSTDTLLAPLVAARPGLRVPGAWDGFELAMRAVLGQQITVRAAARLAGVLVGSCGEPLRVELPVEGLTHVFPDAQRVASSDALMLPMPRARIETIRATASAYASDATLQSPVRDPAVYIERLRTVRGIGEWTLQYISLRALRDPDAFPSGDVALRRAVSLRLGRDVSSRELLTISERWRPWRAYAAQHLWAGLSAAIYS
jgi:AraC family transcriptional regulator of adaptative response / DNA-3-methyladenine glycosylase II